jgi:hypothetical protein
VSASGRRLSYNTVHPNHFFQQAYAFTGRVKSVDPATLRRWLLLRLDLVRPARPRIGGAARSLDPATARSEVVPVI